MRGYQGASPLRGGGAEQAEAVEAHFIVRPTLPVAFRRAGGTIMAEEIIDPSREGGISRNS